MRVDDKKVLTTAYLISETFSRKELMKLILLLISTYFEDKKDESGHKKVTELDSGRKTESESSE